MDLKKIGLAFVVLVVLFAAALLLTSPQISQPVTPTPFTFEEEYENLAEEWKQAGVASGRLHESVDELTQLPDQQLDALKTSLSQQSQQPGATGALAVVYVQLVDVAKASKKVEQTRLSISLNPEDPCTQMDGYRALVQQTEALLGATEGYMLASNDFVGTFPDEAGSIGLSASEADLTGVRSALVEQGELVNGLEQVCAAG